MLSQCSCRSAVHSHPNAPDTSGSKSFPNGRTNFVLKLGKTEQAEANIHTFNFATVSCVLGTFHAQGLSFSTWHAVKVWRYGKCPEELGRCLEVCTRGGYTSLHPSNMPLLSTIPAQPEGTVAVFKAVQFLFTLRWFPERTELSCLRRIVRGWYTITLYYPQPNKSLLGEEVHSNFNMPNSSTVSFWTKPGTGNKMKSLHKIICTTTVLESPSWNETSLLSRHCAEPARGSSCLKYLPSQQKGGGQGGTWLACSLAADMGPNSPN